MRRLVCLTALGACLLAAPAQAQFANQSVGLSLGYMNLNEAAATDWGIPLGILHTAYLDGGFDLTQHVHVMILNERISGSQVVGLTGALGLRYLFLQETWRPYVALDMSYLHIFNHTAGAAQFVGLGPNAGVDFFVMDTLSVGPRAQFNVYFTLPIAFQTSFIFTVEAAAYF